MFRVFLLSCMYVVLLFSFSGCFMPYVASQGVFQAQMLLGRKSIANVLAKKDLTKHDKEQLLLVLKAKEFSEKKLSLAKTSNYTTINLNFKRYVYRVSASKKLAFKPFIWRFPIVGQIPFKGYFVKKSALREAKWLKRQGYDVWVGTVAGYSTPGYFSDPVWPQMLKYSKAALVELIIHELAHATLYIKGQSRFNESFAQFVGRQGTLEFFKTDQNLTLLYKDEDLYTKWMHGLYEKLDRVYKSNRSKKEKLAVKAEILENIATDFAKVQFRSKRYQSINLPKINNAFLMSFKDYHTGHEDFAKLFTKLNGNWSDFVKAILSLKNSKKPFESLQNLL